MAWRSLDRSTPLDAPPFYTPADLFGLRVDEALKAAIAEVQTIAGSKDPSKEASKDPSKQVARVAPPAIPGQPVTASHFRFRGSCCRGGG
jgi:hypothetical protein